jgi:hypothetical protein
VVEPELHGLTTSFVSVDRQWIGVWSRQNLEGVVDRGNVLVLPDRRGELDHPPVTVARHQLIEK